MLCFYGENAFFVFMTKRFFRIYVKKVVFGFYLEATNQWEQLSSCWKMEDFENVDANGNLTILKLSRETVIFLLENGISNK